MRTTQLTALVSSILILSLAGPVMADNGPCAELLKVAPEKNNIRKALEDMWDACSAVRSCKLSCKLTKKRCSQTRKDCISLCKAEEGTKKFASACAKRCKESETFARNVCRKEMKRCKTACRKAASEGECKKARKAFFGKKMKKRFLKKVKRACKSAVGGDR